MSKKQNKKQEEITNEFQVNEIVVVDPQVVTLPEAAREPEIQDKQVFTDENPGIINPATASVIKAAVKKEKPAPEVYFSYGSGVYPITNQNLEKLIGYMTQFNATGEWHYPIENWCGIKKDGKVGKQYKETLEALSKIEVENVQKLLALLLGVKVEIKVKPEPKPEDPKAEVTAE
ncbi:MAG: hypothetical protein KBC90_14850 [Spirochaetes bacterium]|nr:hypothetical protein [Spirochaetota bacterium]